MPSVYDDDSSDDSSEDEFLTPGNKGDSLDREAMIRRKLMESFYGKSMPSSAPPEETVKEDTENGVVPVAGVDALTDAQEEDDEEEDIQMTSDDLDSPYFDADAHTSKYVIAKKIHEVLEVEERLALQVRTLDSTMQTLVYENYSKFIDATDAIRSIGVSVHANEDGLKKLTKGMQVIDETSRSVEDALGTLRDAVAEKLRIKRLLTRLDGLLKLPVTLKQEIQNGRYRLATKSYLSAHAILSKHSSGFESLRIIEADCRSILENMIQDLKHKLLHWSGQSSVSLGTAFSMDEHDDDEDFDEERLLKENLDENNDHKPCEDDPIHSFEPPKSVSEIFECASTLLIVLPKVDEGKHLGVTFDPGLTDSECKSAALAATTRYIERVLDSHQIELQDAVFNTGFADAFDPTGLPLMPEIDKPKHSKLIPTIYLDNILEASTLYGISFSVDGVPSLTDVDRLVLMDFISDAFSTFLSHVRSLLLERSIDEDDDYDEEKETLSGDGDEAYSEISSAMTHLLRSVRDLASGLALPDVGIDVDFAAGLVDQAVVVTETMVRRRVAQKFMNLRYSVVQDCLAPFAKEAMTHVASSDAARVTEIVQMASVALSDGLQLVDDTVKSILTGGVVVSDLKGVDYAMVKEAVQGCTRRFAMWLAATLELLAGCESADRNVTIDTEDRFEENGEVVMTEANSQLPPDDMSELQQDNLNDRVAASLDSVLDDIEASSTPDLRCEFMLAISEMCRLAQRSVMENINMSINTDSSGSRKHNRNTDIFASSAPSSKAQGLSEQDSKVSDRFLIAASRVLALYSMTRGSEAAFQLCQSLHVVAQEDGDLLPESPRSDVAEMLHVLKTACFDCANVFGGEARAGPVPDPLEDELEALNTSTSSFRTRSISSGLSAVKGLSLDVERMFTLKLPTFPHPSSIMTFSRNGVVFVVLNVAFHALREQTRLCTFNTKGYRQLQVDVMLLRFLLPHYVKDETLVEGSNYLSVLYNVLNDVLLNAGERCRDIDCLGQDSFYNPTTGERITLQSIIRNYVQYGDIETKDGDGSAGDKPNRSATFIIA